MSLSKTSEKCRTCLLFGKCKSKCMEAVGELLPKDAIEEKISIEFTQQMLNEISEAFVIGSNKKMRRL